MERKNKISQDLKLKAVHEYLNNNGSIKSIAKKYGVTKIPFRIWLAKYNTDGDSAFFNTEKNKRYTTNFKILLFQNILLAIFLCMIYQ